jgi:hypothetical protein
MSKGACACGRAGRRAQRDDARESLWRTGCEGKSDPASETGANDGMSLRNLQAV